MRAAKLAEADRNTATNAIDRPICIGLGDRIPVVLPPQGLDSFILAAFFSKTGKSTLGDDA